MGITTELYRVRIGSFKQKHTYRTREKVSVYSPYVKSSDIHYRVFLCTVLIGTCMILSELLIKATDYDVPQELYVFIERFLSGVSVGEIHQDIHHHIHHHGFSCCTAFHTTQSWNDSVSILYLYFQERILLLSSDIEINPGPISDKNEILEAIASSKADLLQEIRFVKSDIHCIKQEISTIQQDQIGIKQDMNSMKLKYKALEIDVINIKESIAGLEEQKELLQADVDYLSEEFDRKYEYLDTLDKDIDRLEAYSRRENIRVFGIPEDCDETPLSIKEKLLEIFRVASPHKTWTPRDILRAHRIGTTNDNQDNPRPIIVRFLHWDDKMCLYQGRDDLRTRGVRIADDLTRRQRQTLKKVKDSGRTGYFYKGQLRYRDNKQNSGEKSRVYRRGRRQLNPDYEATAKLYSEITANSNSEATQNTFSQVTANMHDAASSMDTITEASEDINQNLTYNENK